MKKYETQIVLRISKKLRRELEASAKQSRRSVSDFLRLMIEANVPDSSFVPDRID